MTMLTAHARWLTSYQFLRSMTGVDQEVWENLWPGLVRNSTETLFGLLLVLGSGGLLRLYNGLKYGGLKKPDSQQESP